ncbi:hypothetical protein SDC9_117546 [bioreactor metagenome]|uniref:Uncharacterized protein n=1 Tax=bioreactor metagenome TaxID=1076179 RepID=A0A645C0Z0_9ZZZZ
MGNLPVIDQTAGFLALVIEEGLLGRRQLGHRVGVQLLPVGLAAEQLAFPPDRAGFQRIALGIRHLRQDLAIRGENGAGYQRAANRTDGNDQYDRSQQSRQNHQHGLHYRSPFMSLLV